MLDDGVSETTCVACEMTVVPNRSVGEEKVFLVSGLKEVEVVVRDGGVEVILLCQCRRHAGSMGAYFLLLWCRPFPAYQRPTECGQNLVPHIRLAKSH
jgi:hypothetical protein